MARSSCSRKNSTGVSPCTSRSLIVLPSRGRPRPPLERRCTKRARTRARRVPALRRWNGWSWCGDARFASDYAVSPAVTFVVIPSIRTSSDEGHFVDLAQGRHSREHLLERAVAQEGHSLLARRLLDLRRGPALEDHLADAVAHVQQ